MVMTGCWSQQPREGSADPAQGGVCPLLVPARPAEGRPHHSTAGPGVSTGALPRTRIISCKEQLESKASLPSPAHITPK